MPTAMNAPQSVAQPADEALKSSLLHITGGVASASALAEALVESPPNVSDLLSNADMADVPHLLIPTMAVFRALSSERRAALRDGRTPMLFCDLTAEDFRPVWMPAEAVGGRAAVQTEFEDISAAGPSSQLSAILSEALNQFGTGSCVSRIIAQWDLCHQRYVIAAIATKHSTYAQVMACHAAVLCVAESSSTFTYGVYFRDLVC